MIRLDCDSINAVAANWAETIWAVSWQFCLLAMAILMVHWSLNRAAPNWRYWLWQILAIKLLLMPFWTAVAPWTSPNSETNLASDITRDSVKSIATDPVEELRTSITIPEPNEQSIETSPANTRISIIPRHSPVPQNKPKTVHRPVGAKSTSSAQMASEKNTSSGQKTSSHLAGTTRPQIADSLNEVSNAEDTGGLQSRTPESHSVDSSTDLKHESMSVENATPAPVTVPQPIPHVAISWHAWIMLAWLTGVGCYISRIYWHGTALRRRLREAIPAEPGLILRVRNAAARLGLTRVPYVCLLDQEISPFVCGLWRARLVLPRRLSESFSAENLDLVLLHELAHVRRWDLVWGWVSEIGRVLFFFHPLVHVMYYQIRFERELACDQLAMVSAGRDAATYAETLVRVVEQFSNSDSVRFAAVDHSHV